MKYLDPDTVKDFDPDTAIVLDPDTMMALDPDSVIVVPYTTYFSMFVAFQCFKKSSKISLNQLFVD